MQDFCIGLYTARWKCKLLDGRARGYIAINKDTGAEYVADLEQRRTVVEKHQQQEENIFDTHM